MHLLTWRDLVTSQQALSLSSLGNTIPPLDPFQSSVLTYYRIHCLQYSGNPGQHDIDLHPTKSNVLAMTLTHYALSVITYTPLHALIITASESWLFGTKITDEAVWQQAKTTLRQWVTSDAALKAVWYAIRLLKLALQKPNQPQQHMEGMGSMHDLWCLYAAALVCWAVGYSTDPGMEIQQEWRPEDAEMLAANYLSAMNMSTWQDLWEASEVTKRSTRGLLECVRVRIGEVGMGGLLDGAEDVLFRLVEGESQMVKF